MPEYKPLLVIPKAGDPYYNTIKSGGFNPCILGNNDKGQRVKGLNVLPNCVSYATGRFNQIYHEIMGGSGCEYLGNTNACNFVTRARKQGLQIATRPVVGGCMVWSGGTGGYGHVAIVEMDLGNRFLTSESEYYGKPFVTYQRFGEDWRGGCYWMGRSYKFLGCIVNPALQEKDEDDMTKEERYAEWLEFNERHEKELAQEPADEWTEQAIERVKKSGLMVGDPSGNFRPQSKIKREEAAVILANMLPDA